MSEIIFIFRGHEVPIQCSPGEKMKFIMERLCMKLNIAKNRYIWITQWKIFKRRNK